MIICDNAEYTVQDTGLFGVKIVAFSAAKRSRKDGHFDIFIYDSEKQMAPTAFISFGETSASPLLHLIRGGSDFSVVAEDGKRLTFTAASLTLAIFNKVRQKKPSASICLSLQIIQELSRPDVHMGIYRMLGLRSPALA